jgi:hypothetical protein
MGGILMRKSLILKRFARSVAVIFIAVFLFAVRADAHSFIIKPAQLTVPIGGVTDVLVSLSEPFATPDIGLYGYGAMIEAQSVYANGTKTPL